MSSNVLALEPVRALHAHAGRPERAEVEAAVRTILRWTGDNPERGGLIETPARVTRALEESFVGYAQDPAAILQKSFDEIEGYDEMIVLRGVRFESHCEHHMAPDPRPGLGGLRPQRPCGRHQQARSRGRDLCQAFARAACTSLTATWSPAACSAASATTRSCARNFSA